MFGLAAGLILAMAPAPRAGEHESAAGWLQLKRDQRVYRDRVAPLDLREQRELSIIERRQRDRLRRIEQRQERSERLELPARVSQPPDIPRRGPDGAGRRALERQRLDLRMEQYRQPFGERGE
jgi:hypothetical protein